MHGVQILVWKVQLSLISFTIAHLGGCSLCCKLKTKVDNERYIKIRDCFRSIRQIYTFSLSRRLAFNFRWERDDATQPDSQDELDPFIVSPWGKMKYEILMWVDIWAVWVPMPYDVHFVVKLEFADDFVYLGRIKYTMPVDKRCGDSQLSPQTSINRIKFSDCTANKHWM